MPLACDFIQKMAIFAKFECKNGRAIGTYSQHICGWDISACAYIWIKVHAPLSGVRLYVG